MRYGRGEVTERERAKSERQGWWEYKRKCRKERINRDTRGKGEEELMRLYVYMRE